MIEIALGGRRGPLTHFGVEVVTDGLFYWCEKFRKVAAGREQSEAQGPG